MTIQTTLKFEGDISIIVPDDLNLITTYVLQEQGDWFEDEIKFVRRLIQPGQKAIDIGANYGVFTLTLAKSVGHEGRIWAFEPASSTAQLLEQSVISNQWNHVIVDKSALSDHEGNARLSLNQNAELNEIIRGGQSSDSFETVRLTTLDAAMSRYGWQGIDFLKVDAEGEEEAIIHGGKDFLTQESPLIQYEIKVSEGMNLGLTEAFRAVGYDSYRLLPGLNVLVPFEPHGLVDDYLLNLFCCKPDRAQLLAAQGLLVLPTDMQKNESALDLLQRLHAFPEKSWKNTLKHLPYGQLLMPHWLQTKPTETARHIEVVLALQAVSMDTHHEAKDRFHALRIGTGLLTELCKQQATLTRLMTLARLARSFGARQIAVTALNALISEFKRRPQLDLSEPFLPAEAYYDALDLRESVADWFVACALEAQERNARYSSFYAGKAGIPALESIEGIGYGSPEMSRRLALLRKRFSA